MSTLMQSSLLYAASFFVFILNLKVAQSQGENATRAQGWPYFLISGLLLIYVSWIRCLFPSASPEFIDRYSVM